MFRILLFENGLCEQNRLCAIPHTCYRFTRSSVAPSFVMPVSVPAGNDGVVGIALFMGGGTMPNRAVVQSAGGAVKMKAKVLQDEFAKGGKFQYLLLRYTQALITQISQTAVCNRLHSVEQQLCRWVLLSHDRLNTDELIMTQDLLAGMLGVRREGVTVAAGRLQDAGAISYVRAVVSRSSIVRKWKRPSASAIG
jgi:hypothetical protein